MFFGAPDKVQHRFAPPVGDEPLRNRCVLRALRHHQLHETARVLRGRWIHHVFHEVVEVEGILVIRRVGPVEPQTQNTAILGVLLDEGLEGEQLVRLDASPGCIRDRSALRSETAEVQTQWVDALVARGDLTFAFRRTHSPASSGQPEQLILNDYLTPPVSIVEPACMNMK